MSEDGYGGVVGAFPYAARRSGSWLFRAYAVVGTLATLAIGFGFLASLLGVVADTAGGGGGTVTFSRAFVVVVALFVLLPVVAPILLVARRHRTDEGTTRYDAALALGGFVFLLTLYLGLVASMPECFRTAGATTCRPPPTGALAPVVAALYAVPPLAGLLFPLAGAGSVALAHRLAS